MLLWNEPDSQFNSPLAALRVIDWAKTGLVRVKGDLTGVTWMR